MNKKQRIILIVGIIFAVLLVAGGSYAFWMWSSNVNKNVAFNTANLEKYIVYDEGDAKFIGNFQPTSTFCESAHNTVSFYKKSELEDVNVSASIKMQVNSIGENIGLSSDVHWIVTTGDSNITCDDGLSSNSVLASGIFNGVANGQILELYSDIEVTLDEQFYTVWIWIDSNGSNLSELSGETIDTNIWTDFELLGKKEYVVTLDVNGGEFKNGTYLYTQSGEYIYTVPSDGLYQLEVWGAQGGGTSNYIGGYGGYSVGNIELSQGTQLYINVGGSGVADLKTGSIGYIEGGYNGGGMGTYAGDGNTYSATGGSGGGATHIATISGELKELSPTSDLNKILIVAGGGGGAGIDSYESYTYSYAGGNAGGYEGNVVSGESTTCSAGTQSSGNHFGLGGNYTSGTHGAAGGGGGYYGGGGGDVNAPGCGGSGYIGNSLLTNKAMYCYNCSTSSDANTLTYSTTSFSDSPISNNAKSGGGAAKITLKDILSYVIFNKPYGNLPTPTKDGYTFLGWYTEPDGGEEVTEDTIMSLHDDHKLYARWIYSGIYYVKYDANGGKGGPDIQSTNDDGSIILTDSIPTMDGYTFLGWSTDKSATSATYSAGSEYSFTSSTTLYAVWKINPLYLFNKGDSCTSVTGGWSGNGYDLCDCTQHDGNISGGTINVSGSGYSFGKIGTVNSINVSKYNTLYCYVDSVSSGSAKFNAGGTTITLVQGLNKINISSVTWTSVYFHATGGGASISSVWAE